MEILNEKIIEIIEKDKITEQEYNFLVHYIEELINCDDILHDFYQIISRIEKYEKNEK